jgi:hypothetical protein
MRGRARERLRAAQQVEAGHRLTCAPRIRLPLVRKRVIHFTIPLSTLRLTPRPMPGPRPMLSARCSDRMKESRIMVVRTEKGSGVEQG